jgi:hypothetical protein
MDFDLGSQNLDFGCEIWIRMVTISIQMQDLKSMSHDGTSSWDEWVFGFELLMHELGDNMKA